MECQECQSCKIGRHTRKPIKELPIPSHRFSNVYMDIIGPLDSPDTESTSKPRYLVTIIDSYTRWLEAVPVIDISV